MCIRSAASSQDARDVGHAGEHTAHVKPSQHAGGRPAARPRADPSSLRMVPVPRFLVNGASLPLPNRSTQQVSLASCLRSPLTSMVIVVVVAPGAKVSVPVLATESL